MWRVGPLYFLTVSCASFPRILCEYGKVVMQYLQWQVTNSTQQETKVKFKGKIICITYSLGSDENSILIVRASSRQPCTRRRIRSKPHPTCSRASCKCTAGIGHGHGGLWHHPETGHLKCKVKDTFSPGDDDEVFLPFCKSLAVCSLGSQKVKWKLDENWRSPRKAWAVVNSTVDDGCWLIHRKECTTVRLYYQGKSGMDCLRILLPRFVYKSQLVLKQK